jgi:hypothetical protein
MKREKIKIKKRNREKVEEERKIKIIKVPFTNQYIVRN